MLYAEQAVHTSESSRYKTQALVNFMIALRRSCFDVRDLGRVLAAIMRRVDLVSSLQRAPGARRRRLPDRDRRHRLVGLTAIDAPTVFLGGFLLGASFHAADHVVDRHLGGHSEDVIGLGLLAVLAVLGLALTFGGRLLSVNPIAATAEASNEAPERRAHLFSVADP
jgi:hypothetical protein